MKDNRDDTTAAGGRRWCEQEVLKAILQREELGLPLHHAAVARGDSGLHNAALRRFGRWDSALRAAGVNPDRVRLHRKWDRQAVVRRIQQLARRDEPLNSAAVQKHESGLYGAALRCFIRWDEALRAAGIDPNQHRKNGPPWTRGRVMQALQRIHAGRGRVNRGALAGTSLSNAADRLFGSWDNALRAIGLDPSGIRLCRKSWTQQAVLNAIQRKHRAGEPLAHSLVLPTSMREAGIRLLGSWDAALSAAGLDPSRIRLRRPRCKPWTTRSVLKEIRRKHAAGEPLNAQDVSPFSLRISGVRFFGSWDAALETAGLDPSKIRKRRRKGSGPVPGGPRSGRVGNPGGASAIRSAGR